MMIIAIKGATTMTMTVVVVLMVMMMMMMMVMTIKLTIEIKERLGGERNIKVSPRQHPLELATLLPLYF